MLNVPALTFSLASLFHARMWLEADTQKQEARQWWLAVIFCLLAMFTYYQACVVGFVILAWVVFARRWQAIRRPRVLVTLAAVGAFYLLRGRRMFAAQPLADVEETEPAVLDAPEVPDEVEVLGAAPTAPMELWRKLLIAGVLLVVGVSLAFEAREMLASSTLLEVVRDMVRAWLFPLLIAALLLIDMAHSETQGGIVIFDFCIVVVVIQSQLSLRNIKQFGHFAVALVRLPMSTLAFR